MPLDGDLTKYRQPKKPRHYGLLAYFVASFVAGIMGMAVWAAFESYVFVKAPMVAKEVQQTMRLKGESGRPP